MSPAFFFDDDTRLQMARTLVEATKQDFINSMLSGIRSGLRASVLAALPDAYRTGEAVESVEASEPLDGADNGVVARAGVTAAAKVAFVRNAVKAALPEGVVLVQLEWDAGSRRWTFTLSFLNDEAALAYAQRTGASKTIATPFVRSMSYPAEDLLPFIAEGDTWAESRPAKLTP